MAKMVLDEYGKLEEPCLSCDKTYMEILSYEWCCDEKECPYTAKRSDGEMKVGDSKIITIAYLISENMNDKEIFKMCMLLLICVFKGWK